MRIIDWISDVVSSDLGLVPRLSGLNLASAARGQAMPGAARWCCDGDSKRARRGPASRCRQRCHPHPSPPPSKGAGKILKAQGNRSEEHTSELQSLMRNSFADYIMKKKNTANNDM